MHDQSGAITSAKSRNKFTAAQHQANTIEVGGTSSVGMGIIRNASTQHKSSRNGGGIGTRHQFNS